MKVTIDKYKLKSGEYGLRLTIYSEGKRTRENLNLRIYQRPKTDLQKRYNEEILREAEVRRLRRLGQEQGITIDNRANQPFRDYYEHYKKVYLNKDPRMIKAAGEHFFTFINNPGIRIKDLKPIMFDDFAVWLKGKFEGDTPHNYFRYVKKILKRAKKEKLLPFELDEIEASLKRSNDVKKPILTLGEIKLMYGGKCSNNVVKRAYLFSLNTALAYAEIKALVWGQIHGDKITMKRGKTQRELFVYLNKNALAQLPERGNPIDLVFPVPTFQACLKQIRSLAKSVGIEKKITWHSARHSVGTYLDGELGVDITTVRDILGHTDIKTTMRYRRLNNSKAKEAMKKIPDMD